MISGKEHIKDQISALAKQKVPFLFVINFDGDKALVEPIASCAERDVLFKVRHLKNFEDKPKSNDPFTFAKFPISAERYQLGFEIVQQAIADGNTYLINLTKGTIDATIPDAYNKLKESYKEIAEHHTIVDLIRNDLNRVSKRVGLEKFRTIEKIITHDAELLTVSSRIAGQLQEGYEQEIGDLLYEMLPAGSVTGAPKKKTVAVIKEAEQYDRGFYTGVFGIFDGYNLQSAVMIRFIENIDGQFFFKSGGGITTFSDCAAEYQELIDKVYLPITNK